MGRKVKVEVCVTKRIMILVPGRDGRIVAESRGWDEN